MMAEFSSCSVRGGKSGAKLCRDAHTWERQANIPVARLAADKCYQRLTICSYVQNVPGFTMSEAIPVATDMPCATAYLPWLGPRANLAKLYSGHIVQREL